MRKVLFRQMFWDVTKDYHERHLPERVAALTFNLLLALPPLLALVLVLESILATDLMIISSIVSWVSSLLGNNAGRLLLQILTNTTALANEPQLLLLGGFVLLYAFVRLLHSLQGIFWDIFHEHARQSERSRRTSVVLRLFSMLLLTLIMILFFALFILGQTILASVVAGTAPWMAQFVLQVGVLAATIGFLFLLYRFLSQGSLPYLACLKGAVVGSGLLFGLTYAAGYIIGESTSVAIYGVAGTLVAGMLWVYYALSVVVLGAVVSVYYADHDR